MFLKPLFSFAGMGVVIDVTQADIDAVKDPENWILQQKVKYADVLKHPMGLPKQRYAYSIFGKMAGQGLKLYITLQG